MMAADTRIVIQGVEVDGASEEMGVKKRSQLGADTAIIRPREAPRHLTMPTL
jgi:hypothetical protein